MSWNTICTINDILPNGGRCALIDGKQVAVFRVSDDDGDSFYALSNYDPFSHANVLSRGLIGCIEGELVVASPIYKQHFNLKTGQCLQDESVTLQTWEVTEKDGDILVNSSSAQAA